jgi:hypothetical protein
VVDAGVAAWSIRALRPGRRSRRRGHLPRAALDFDLERLRELLESAETGPDVAFRSPGAQTALRMLRRNYALRVARARGSVDGADEDGDALQAWRAAHPAHPPMNKDTVQLVIGRGAIRRAGCAATSDEAGG